MNRKASDIVKHSLELLDMDESTAISYSEMTRYLNKSFADLCGVFQKYGLHYFYGKMEAHQGANNLPWDFGWIDLVKRGSYILPKKSGANTDLSYDLVNNKLVIYGCANAECYYYKKPFYLSYPNRILSLGGLAGSIVNKFGNPITRTLTDYGDYTYTEYNPKTEETTELFTSSDDIIDIVNGKQIGVKLYNNDTTYVSLLNKKGVALRNTREGQLFYDNGNVGLATLSEDVITIREWNKEWNINTTLNELTDNVVKSGDYYYTIVNNNIYNITLDEVTDFKAAYIFPMEFDDTHGLIGLYNNSASLFLYNTEIPLETSNSVISLLKVSNEKGYGFLTSDGTDYFIESHIPDTLLDFPNGVFYDYLSYSVALSIALKMGLDLSWIEQAKEIAEKQLLEGVDLHGNYPTITDVYNNGAII